MDVLRKYKKISILQGGISDESEISLLSAKEVYRTLKNKYNVTLIDVNRDCTKLISDIKKSKPDIIFNCLHGYFGEDGQIQSILNYLEIPYTHSGVLTSSILMNKYFSKILFEKLGVATPNGNLIAKINSSGHNKGPMMEKLIEKYGYVKNEIAAIGDTVVDLPMFERAGLSIAVNTNDVNVIEKADYHLKSEDMNQLTKLIIDWKS